MAGVCECQSYTTVAPFDLSSDDITGGSLRRALVVLATPILVQQLVLVGQQLVDVFWLGRLGPDPVAAVGLVAPIVGLLTVGSYVAYTGGQVLVSQHVGAGDRIAARRVGFHAVVFVGVVNLLFAAGVALGARPLVGLFDPGARVAGFAATYLAILAFAHVFGGMSDAIEAGFVGWGDSRTPMLVNLVAVGTNVVLDPFLIFGWGPFPAWGIAGAAAATMAGYALGLAVGIGATTLDRTDFGFTRDAIGFRFETLRDLLRVGVPRAGQEAGRQVARLAVVGVVAAVGGAAGLTAYTVGARVASIAFVPAIAVGSAATSLVGQNLGADQPHRAHRATWLGVTGGTSLIGAVGLLQFFAPVSIAHLFVPDLTGQALVLTVGYLQILALGYWALGAIYTVQAGFDGASRTEIPMYATLAQYWGVRVPAAVVGAYVLGVGVWGAFWGVTLSNVVAALGLGGYFSYAVRNGLFDRATETQGAADAD
ncbi:MAG: MATE family efflux transporter [Halolamina sp.]